MPWKTARETGKVRVVLHRVHIELIYEAERCESGRIGLTANELTWETGSEGSNPSLSANLLWRKCEFVWSNGALDYPHLAGAFYGDLYA